MNEKFKILSIDGGGMRGIIPAKILCELEEELQRREGPEARLCDYFDLICGTSTGGIIAIGLALGMSAKEMLNLYVAHGKEIFSATLLQRFKSRTLYNREALQKHLQQLDFLQLLNHRIYLFFQLLLNLILSHLL